MNIMDYGACECEKMKISANDNLEVRYVMTHVFGRY